MDVGHCRVRARICHATAKPLFDMCVCVCVYVFFLSFPEAIILPLMAGQEACVAVATYAPCQQTFEQPVTH